MLVGVLLTVFDQSLNWLALVTFEKEIRFTRQTSVASIVVPRTIRDNNSLHTGVCLIQIKAHVAGVAVILETLRSPAVSLCPRKTVLALEVEVEVSGTPFTVLLVWGELLTTGLC